MIADCMPSREVSGYGVFRSMRKGAKSGRARKKRDARHIPPLWIGFNLGRLALVVAQLSQHRQDFFVGDESSSMPDFVLIDCHGELASRGRQLFVTIGELATFDTRRRRNAITTTVSERRSGLGWLSHAQVLRWWAVQWGNRCLHWWRFHTRRLRPPMKRVKNTPEHLGGKNPGL